MALVSMPLADVAPQRKRMYVEKPCSKPLLAPAAAAIASAAWPRPAQPEREAEAPIAMFVRASEGVRIVRKSVFLAVEAGGVLQLGDRILVPADGGAQAVFQEQDGQVLLGSFDGGTDASLAYFSRRSGACSVVFDLLTGHVDLSLSTMRRSRLDGEPPSSAQGRKAIGFYSYTQAIAGR